MKGIMALVFFGYYVFAMFFSFYIARTKIIPTAEKYGGIDFNKLTTFEWYKLMFVGYRKICKEKGLPLLFSNVFIVLGIVGILIFFLMIFTME